MYEKNNTNYENNGLIIQPLSCILDIELNGEWKLTAEVPYTEDTKAAVIPDSVIMIDTPTAKKQRYRIYETEIDDTDMTITASASPIFLDAAGAAFLIDTRPTGKNGQQALDIMTAGTVYSGQSDIADVKTAYYIRKNLVEAISSDDDYSFLNVWGGEIIYNNEKIVINKRAGGDYGVRAEFGHNLTGLQATEDFADIVTRIVPEAYNGYTLPGDTPWVDSPLIDNYAVPHTKVIQYQDIKLAEDAQEDEENVTICDTLQDLYDELEKRAETEFEAGIDKPAVNYKCDMVELSKYEEYKDFKDLVSVWIGDTVHCSNRNVGIKVDARCIKLQYDCIREEVTSVELGNFTEKFLSDIASTMSSVAQAITPGGSVMAEQISGIINAGKASLRAQKTIAEKQDVRAILFEDIDPESPTYGAMALGTQGLEISRQRTADGREWEWTTALTAEGLIANVIVAGVISDKLGKSFWDLNTGQLEMSGVFKQYNDETGFISISIEDHEVFLFDYRNNGKHAGSVGTLHQGEQVGVGLWTRESGFVTLGVWDPEDKQINSIFSYDTMYPKRTPYITNTANGTIFKNNPGGGIVVENGLIKSWNLGTATGTLNLMGANGQEAIVMTIKDGLIQSWRVD